MFPEAFPTGIVLLITPDPWTVPDVLGPRTLAWGVIIPDPETFLFASADDDIPNEGVAIFPVKLPLVEVATFGWRVLTSVLGAANEDVPWAFKLSPPETFGTLIPTDCCPLISFPIEAESPESSFGCSIFPCIPALEEALIFGPLIPTETFGALIPPDNEAWLSLLIFDEILL